MWTNDTKTGCLNSFGRSIWVRLVICQFGLSARYQMLFSKMEWTPCLFMNFQLILTVLKLVLTCHLNQTCTWQMSYIVCITQCKSYETIIYEWTVDMSWYFFYIFSIIILVTFMFNQVISGLCLCVCIYDFKRGLDNFGWYLSQYLCSTCNEKARYVRNDFRKRHSIWDVSHFTPQIYSCNTLNQA